MSIDGSANVSLATTTNHTHTFASLTSKPTTLSGYGITDAPTKSGSGATGTWGISISGNAATATTANYATTAGSAPASDVYAWAKASTKPSYNATEVKLSNYSKASSYSAIAASDTVNQAIGKLEGAISGLETLLASI